MPDRDFDTLAVCAFRYAIDRNTAISYVISNILIREYEKLSYESVRQIIRDIERAKTSGLFEDVMNDWQKLSTFLQAKLRDGSIHE